MWEGSVRKDLLGGLVIVVKSSSRGGVKGEVGGGVPELSLTRGSQVADQKDGGSPRGGQREGIKSVSSSTILVAKRPARAKKSGEKDLEKGGKTVRVDPSETLI